MRSIYYVLLTLLLLPPLARAAQNAPAAAPPPAGAVHVVTFVDVAQKAIPQAMGQLKLYRDASRGEPGLLYAELFQDLGRPYNYVVTEIWRDRASYDAHRRGTAATGLPAALKELQTGPIETHALQGFATGAQNPPGGGRAKLGVIARLEIAAPRMAEFSALARAFADRSRGEEGAMRFDILQDAARPSHFTIAEVWSSPEEYEAHRSSPQTRQFREAVAPMLVGSFDERLYGKFN